MVSVTNPIPSRRAGFLLLALAVAGLHHVRAERFPGLGFEGRPLIEDAVREVFSPGADAIQTNRIRVAFYNLEMFTDGIKDGKNRTEALAQAQARGAAEIVEEINADILLIAEIENMRALNYLNDALSSPFPKGYVVQFGAQSQREEKMNVAMLTRYVPESVQEVDFGPLTGKGRPTRGLFRAVFDLGGGHYLLVYATHLKSNWGDRNRNFAQRYNAMTLLRDDVARMFHDYPDRRWEVLLMADFNTDPRIDSLAKDPTLDVLDDWHDLWTEHPEVETIATVPTRHGDPYRVFPPALFDRVLAHPQTREAPWVVSLPSVVARGAVTNDVSALPGQGGHVSDHYPIYVDLILE